jgi:hypothetical protein
MKLTGHFTDFLNDIVNLNPARLTRLENSVSAIRDVIRSSSWTPRGRGFVEQGSWAHKTIIKPLESKAFDADLLALIDPVVGWEAKDYINSLYDVFSNHATYKEKVRRWDYCVTITYADDFKIDITPCIKDKAFQAYAICNRNTNAFVKSEPIQYTEWLISKNDLSKGNTFRKATRILKYLRDIKGNFTCPSVLLTTLLGYRMSLFDPFGSGFDDVPTALKTIAGRLDDWLQANPAKPVISNPSLQEEDFGRLWDDDTQYGNFRDKINLYRGWIDDAFDEADRDESIGKWRRVFGEEFAKSVDLEEAASIVTKAVALAKAADAALVPPNEDMVNLLERYGSRVIPPGILHLPYMERPKWRVARQAPIPVTVRASLYTGRNGTFVRQVTDYQPLPKRCWLKFDAVGSMGAVWPNDYEIKWRITNTDREAIGASALRGGFYPSDDKSSRWEALQYRGLHLAEAFVVRKRDRTLVGSSAPFYVVIE